MGKINSLSFSFLAITCAFLIHFQTIVLAQEHVASSESGALGLSPETKNNNTNKSSHIFPSYNQKPTLATTNIPLSLLPFTTRPKSSHLHCYRTTFISTHIQHNKPISTANLPLYINLQPDLSLILPTPQSHNNPPSFSIIPLCRLPNHHQLPSTSSIIRFPPAYSSTVINNNLPTTTHLQHNFNPSINDHNPFIKTPFQRFHFTPPKLIHRNRIVLVSCNNTQQQDTKESHNKVSKAKSNALTDLDNDVEQQHVDGFSGNWPPWNNLPLRYKLIGTTSLAFVICNMDKVNLSIAIIPLSHQFGWSSSTARLVQSSFFWGYAMSQFPGGWLAKIFGGRKVLEVGVLVKVFRHLLLLISLSGQYHWKNAHGQ